MEATKNAWFKKKVVMWKEPQNIFTEKNSKNENKMKKWI